MLGTRGRPSPPCGSPQGRTARTSGQRRRTLPLGKLDGELTQGEQMETRHERQRIQMERRRYGAMIGWRGNWRLNGTHRRCHRMSPGRGNKPRSEASYLCSLSSETPSRTRETWRTAHAPRRLQIARFEGGKIIERWDNSDELGILKQLGAAPQSVVIQPSQVERTDQ